MKVRLILIMLILLLTTAIIALVRENISNKSIPATFAKKLYNSYIRGVYVGNIYDVVEFTSEDTNNPVLLSGQSLIVCKDFALQEKLFEFVLPGIPKNWLYRGSIADESFFSFIYEDNKGEERFTVVKITFKTSRPKNNNYSVQDINMKILFDIPSKIYNAFDVLENPDTYDRTIVCQSKNRKEIYYYNEKGDLVDRFDIGKEFTYLKCYHTQDVNYLYTGDTIFYFENGNDRLVKKNLIVLDTKGNIDKALFETDRGFSEYRGIFVPVLYDGTKIYAFHEGKLEYSQKLENVEKSSGFELFPYKDGLYAFRRYLYMIEYQDNIVNTFINEKIDDKMHEALANRGSAQYDDYNILNRLEDNKWKPTIYSFIVHGVDPNGYDYSKHRYYYNRNTIEGIDEKIIFMLYNYYKKTWYFFSENYVYSHDMNDVKNSKRDIIHVNNNIN